jgi:hypothetical protein
MESATRPGRHAFSQVEGKRCSVVRDSEVLLGRINFASLRPPGRSQEHSIKLTCAFTLSLSRGEPNVAGSDTSARTTPLHTPGHQCTVHSLSHRTRDCNHTSTLTGTE